MILAFFCKVVALMTFILGVVQYIKNNVLSALIVATDLPHDDANNLVCSNSQFQRNAGTSCPVLAAVFFYLIFFYSQSLIYDVQHYHCAEM